MFSAGICSTVLFPIQRTSRYSGVLFKTNPVCLKPRVHKSPQFHGLLRGSSDSGGVVAGVLSVSRRLAGIA